MRWKVPQSLVHFSLGLTWLHQKAHTITFPHSLLPYTASCPTQPLVPHSLLSHKASCPTQPLALHSLLSYTASCPTQPLVLHSLLSYTACRCTLTLLILSHVFLDTCTGAGGAVWNSSSNNVRKCSGAAPSHSHETTEHATPRWWYYCMARVYHSDGHVRTSSANKPPAIVFSARLLSIHST